MSFLIFVNLFLQRHHELIQVLEVLHLPGVHRNELHEGLVVSELRIRRDGVDEVIHTPVELVDVIVADAGNLLMHVRVDLPEQPRTTKSRSRLEIVPVATIHRPTSILLELLTRPPNNLLQGVDRHFGVFAPDKVGDLVRL